MTAYQNCKVRDARHVKIESDEARVGYGFKHCRSHAAAARSSKRSRITSTG